MCINSNCSNSKLQLNKTAKSSVAVNKLSEISLLFLKNDVIVCLKCLLLLTHYKGDPSEFSVRNVGLFRE